MKNEGLVYAAAAVLCVGVVAQPRPRASGQEAWLQPQHQRQCGELRGPEGDFHQRRNRAGQRELHAEQGRSADARDQRRGSREHSRARLGSRRLFGGDLQGRGGRDARGGRPDGARDLGDAHGGAHLLQRPVDGFQRVDGRLHRARAARCVAQPGSRRTDRSTCAASTAP